jgi:hypothetical protein
MAFPLFSHSVSAKGYQGFWVGVNGDLEVHSVSSYLIEGIPRSLQIFFARISLISECLGIADLLLSSGLCHHE